MYPEPHAQVPTSQKRLPVRRKAVTYISAFRCTGGVVLCADTLETIGDQKQYCEKLVKSSQYPIVIAGAGVDEFVDAFVQEVLERVERELPKTIKQLKAIIKESISEVYTSDVPVSALEKKDRTQEFIVAAKPPDDDFVIFRLKNKRIYPITDHVVIGYATAPNIGLLKRMYRDPMPIAQGVVLGAYLVAQSKNLDQYVGGDTRIAIVASHGAFLEDEEYVKQLESRAKELLKSFDNLFLVTADVSVGLPAFYGHLKEFTKVIVEAREKYSHETTLSFFEAMRNKDWPGDAYSKFPENTTVTVTATSRAIVFKEGKPWLLVPDGKTDDGRAKLRLVALNNPEAKGLKSFEPKTDSPLPEILCPCGCGAVVAYPTELTSQGLMVYPISEELLRQLRLCQHLKTR
jgi:20S proteasome alpha/beta subunit